MAYAKSILLYNFLRIAKAKNSLVTSQHVSLHNSAGEFLAHGSLQIEQQQQHYRRSQAMLRCFTAREDERIWGTTTMTPVLNFL